MIGEKSFNIDYRDFVKGMSSSEFLPEGGFSSGTYGMNPLITPGVLYPVPAVVDASTNLVGRMAASVDNNTTAASIDRFFLAINASTFDGTYYWWNGTILTLKRTDTTNNYTYGKNDIIVFGNEIYATSNEALVRWTANDGTFNVAFQSWNDTVAPHPALLYENNAYYGDGNELWRQTTAGSVPTIILTLPTDRVITALGIDPGSGRMLVSTVSALNVSDTLSTIARIDFYDGFSNKTTRSVIIDDMVTAFYLVGGVVYVGYGQRLGYWTGTGIQFLRKLNVTFDNLFLPYKHHFTNIGNTLYVLDYQKILAYGEIINNQPKVFYNIYRTTDDPLMVVNLGQNKLGIGFSDTNAFLTLDTSSHASLGASNFKSNKYPFDRYITFTQLVVEFSEPIPTDGNSIASFSILDETGTETQIKLLTNTVANTYIVTIPYPTLKLRSLQLIMTPVQTFGFKRCTVFYNDKE